jgi:hypothetical protein
LAKSLREKADREAEFGLKFQIVETGGIPVQRKVQKSNPTATGGCNDSDCLPCDTGRGDGGNCHSCGANYTIECGMCPAGQSLYHIETSKNLYTRAKEHMDRCKSKNKNSFMHIAQAPGKIPPMSRRNNHSKSYSQLERLLNKTS